MYYLIQRSGTFYFSRRVPESFRGIDKRDVIRFSRKTRDRKKALRLAIAENDQLEKYWSTLSVNGDPQAGEHYKALVKRAELIGYSYMHNSALAQLPLNEIIERLLHVSKENYNEQHVEAVLGKVTEPVMQLDQAITHYFKIAKDKVFNKSIS